MQPYRLTVYLCVPTTISSTNKCEHEHVNLSLYRLILVYSLVVSQCLYSQIYYGDVYMLKIVYPTCCGLDVHKDFIFACVASTGETGITSYKNHRFSTLTKGLRELADWLKVNSCSDVCMESTGKYWIPVYNILEATCKIVLAHPKYVKAIRGKKTDKKDAKWIADIF